MADDLVTFREVAKVCDLLQVEDRPPRRIALEMCVLSQELHVLLPRRHDRATYMRLELVDQCAEPQLDDIRDLLDELTISRRRRFVFMLTLWIPAGAVVTDMYDVGSSYRFENVHHLSSIHGGAVGSANYHRQPILLPLPPLPPLSPLSPPSDQRPDYRALWTRRETLRVPSTLWKPEFLLNHQNGDFAEVLF